MIDGFNLTWSSFLMNICASFRQSTEEDQTTSSVKIAILGYRCWTVWFVDQILPIGHGKLLHNLFLPRRLVNDIGSLLHHNHRLLNLSNALLMILSSSLEIRWVRLWRGIFLKGPNDVYIKILHIFFHHGIILILVGRFFLLTLQTYEGPCARYIFGNCFKCFLVIWQWTISYSISLCLR